MENENLWETAYEELKTTQDTKNMVAVHEKIMSLQLKRSKDQSAESQRLDNSRIDLGNVENAFGKWNATEQKEAMHIIAQDGLFRAQRNSTTQEAAVSVTRFVKSCRESISTALSASPAASIAWAGVCTILPLLENGINQRLEHAVLLAYVLDQAEWYSKLSANFATQSRMAADGIVGSGVLREDLKRKIVDILKLLIKANMDSVCRYYHTNKLIVFLGDSIKFSDWAETLQTIKKAEEVFRTRSRQYYDDVIAKSISSIDKHMEKQNQRTRYNETLKLWSKYQTHRAEVDHQKILAGTGDWFFEHPDFATWSQWASESSLLVLKADPGCGKSILASEAIRRLEKEGSHTVAHFFFKRSSEDSNAVDALKAILHQLLDKHDELLDRPVKGATSISDYMSRNSEAPPGRMVDILWDILEAATGPPNDNGINMACVLDGMDECEIGADEFCERLQNYFAKGGQRIKFLITSRWNDSRLWPAKVSFKNITSCRMIDVTKIEGNDKGKDCETRLRDERIRLSRHRDINRVIEHGIKSLTSDADESKQLENLLQPGPRRTFLWACIVFRYLRVEKGKADASPRSWIDRITRKYDTDRLTKYVDDVYEQLLDEAGHLWRDKEQLAVIFKIVAAAKRPLTLHELRIACAIHAIEPAKNKQDERLKDIERLKSMMMSKVTDIDEFRETIQQKCGFFLELDCFDRVSFFHETAREFLVEGWGERRSEYEAGQVRAIGPWKRSVNMRGAHNILATICVRAIFIRLISVSPAREPELVETPLEEDITCAKDFGFFAYSSEALDGHMRGWRNSDSRALVNDTMGFLYIKSYHVGISATLSKLCTWALNQLNPSQAQQGLHPGASATIDDFPGLVATGLAELAVHTTPKSNINHPKRLLLLADCYFARFGILHNLSDLREAIDLIYEAKEQMTKVEYYTDGSKMEHTLPELARRRAAKVEEDVMIGEELARRLDEFSENRLERYKFTRDEENLTQAISLKRDAIGFTDEHGLVYNIRKAEACLLECENRSNDAKGPLAEEVEAWIGKHEATSHVSKELDERLDELRRQIGSIRAAIEGN
ncbi:hypothetical protein F5Y10DRAFT_243392 [Nemania abortiva]|nr:hypothetical protein F5Y10DRAFT_243392 [Nemania abortiva]